MSPSTFPNAIPESRIFWESALLTLLALLIFLAGAYFTATELAI